MQRRIMIVLCIILAVLCGCTDTNRGLYSSYIAKQHFEEHYSELETAALWMKDNPNIWFVFKGEDSKRDSRIYTQIEGYSVFSTNLLSQAEIDGIKTNILPAFSDTLLESIRRQPEGFAQYVFFIYQRSIFDPSYEIAKEIQRYDIGQLTDKSYYTEEIDVQNNWYIVGYSG